MNRPNVLGLVEDECARAPELPALVFEDGVGITRRELLTQARSFASYLARQTGPGDSVAIMLGNRAEYFIAWLAAIMCRASLVSINPGAQEHDAGHILRDCGAKVVITSGEHLSLIERLRESCPALREVIAIGNDEPFGLAAYAGENCQAGDSSAVSPDDVVSVYYTSGTTGPPKGCMLNHNFWLRFVGVFTSLFSLQSTDRLLCWFQFSYVDPPWMLLASLQAGTTLVAMRRFSVSRFWPTVVENEVTILFGSASVPLLLLAKEPTEAESRHRVRYCVHVGIPVDAHRECVERWGFPWYEAYGLTETGLVIVMPPAFGNEMVGSGSMGLPCSEVEVRVVDERGADVESGEVGELVLKAPGLMSGYLGRPEQTAEVFRGGWFHTGDLVRRDNRGFIYFMGRAKDIVRRSGENISAAEVEAVLKSHQKVVDAAVIPVPDPLRGEEVKAFVLIESSESAESLPPSELVEHCRSRLAPFKVPRYWVYRWEDFPRTPSMRVRKEALKAADPRTEVIWDVATNIGPAGPPRAREGA
jgi:carnitine-CoA ligase